MQSAKYNEPFGEADIPPLSEGKQSASYKASDWNRLRQPWSLEMYLTLPAGGMVAEKPSVTLSVSAMNLLLVPREPDPILRIIGQFDSGLGDVAEKHDEYLVRGSGETSG